LDVIERDGAEWKLEDARFIPEAVREPDAIFEGLRRPNQRQGLCYSVRPTRDPEEEESPTLPRYDAGKEDAHKGEGNLECGEDHRFLIFFSEAQAAAKTK